MKKRFLTTLFIALLLTAATPLLAAVGIGESAAPSSGTKSSKTFSASTHMAKLATSGYGIELEYHGLGAFGIFAGGYQSLYSSLTGFKADLSGFGFSGGTKYYLNYTKSGLDSFYVGGEYRYLSEKYTDTKDRSQEVVRSGAIAMFGKRFDYSFYFFDLAIGCGPMYIHKNTIDDKFMGMSSKDIRKIRNSEGSWEGGMDLKVMAGVSF